MSAFWQWFDSRVAQAMATPLGQHMAERGYAVMHTGGGCLAWQSPARGPWRAWIADEGAGLGDDLSDWQGAQAFGAMLCTDDGDFDESGPQAATLADCLAWADEALTGKGMQ